VHPAGQLKVRTKRGLMKRVAHAAGEKSRGSRHSTPACRDHAEDRKTRSRKVLDVKSDADDRTSNRSKKHIGHIDNGSEEMKDFP